MCFFRIFVIKKVSGLIGFAVLACTSVATADAATERARALYEEAGQLEREGRWSAAQDRLRSAVRLRDTPNLHYALGWALENDDKLLESKAEYEAALRLSRERPGTDEVARLAGVRLADLEKKVATIRVRITGPSRLAARVTLDGREMKQDTVVNPGSHVVRVERGEGPSEQMIYVGRGTIRVVEVEARLPPPTPDQVGNATAVRVESAATTADPPRAGQNVLPWVLTTGGLAMVVGGAALLGSAATESGDQSGKQGVGFGLGGLGVVAVSVGAFMLFHRELKPVIRF